MKSSWFAPCLTWVLRRRRVADGSQKTINILHISVLEINQQHVFTGWYRSGAWLISTLFPPNQRKNNNKALKKKKKKLIPMAQCANLPSASIGLSHRDGCLKGPVNRLLIRLIRQQIERGDVFGFTGHSQQQPPHPSVVAIQWSRFVASPQMLLSLWRQSGYVLWSWCRASLGWVVACHEAR